MNFLSYLFPNTFNPEKLVIEPEPKPFQPSSHPTLRRKYRASSDSPFYLSSGSVKSENIVAVILNEKINSDYVRFNHSNHPGTDLFDSSGKYVEIQVKRRQWAKGYSEPKKCLSSCFEGMLNQDPEAIFALCETPKESSKLLRVTLCRCFDIYINLSSDRSKTGIRTCISRSFMMECGGIEIWNEEDHRVESTESQIHSYLLRQTFNLTQ